MKFTSLIYILESEESETIIFYSMRLLEKNSNIVTIDERNTHGIMFRICTRSESILQLAYYANQVSIISVCRKKIHSFFFYDSFERFLYWIRSLQRLTFRLAQESK